MVEVNKCNRCARLVAHIAVHGNKIRVGFGPWVQ
jgi:hypothetical protein